MQNEFKKLNARSRIEMEDGNPDTIISALVIMTQVLSQDEMDQLMKAGGKVGSQIGTVWTLDFALSDLKAIHDLDFIKAIEFSCPIYPE